MGSVLVSIVVPSYNYAEYLEAALESALRQTGCSFEVLVVDDASTDGTAAILEKFEARPGVRIIRNAHNLGLVANVARGLELAHGEYVTFLPADDLLLPGYLDAATTFLRRNPHIDLVYGEMYCLDAAGNFLARQRVGGTPLSGYAGGRNEFGNLLIDGCYINGPVLARRAAYAHFGAYRPEFRIADYEMFIRWAAQGAQFGFVPVPFGAMRYHSRNHGGFETFVPNGKCAHELAGIILEQCTLERREALDGYEPLIWRWMVNRCESARNSGFTDDGTLAPLIDAVHERLLTIARLNEQNHCRPKLSLLTYLDDRTRINDLRRSVDGLLHQTHTAWELLVVQPPGSALDAICEHLDPLGRVRSICLTESGPFGDAMNAALNIAGGNILMYLRLGRPLGSAQLLERVLKTLAEQPGDVFSVRDDFAEPDGLDELIFRRRAIGKVFAFPDHGSQEFGERSLFDRLNALRRPPAIPVVAGTVEAVAAL